MPDNPTSAFAALVLRNEKLTTENERLVAENAKLRNQIQEQNQTPHETEKSKAKNSLTFGHQYDEDDEFKKIY